MKRIHKSAWLLALSSGLLQILIFPLPGLYMLCWLALAPLIYAILRARESDAAELLASDPTSYLGSGHGETRLRARVRERHRLVPG